MKTSAYLIQVAIIVVYYTLFVTFACYQNSAKAGKTHKQLLDIFIVYSLE